MPTKINYLDETWNPITGCSHSGSPGCDHCWARAFANRHRGRFGYPADDPFRPTFHPDRLEQPLRWRKPRVIGVVFMGDLFHKDVPIAWQKAVLDTIRRADRHTFMLFTKRPKRMRALFRAHSAPDNAWAFVSVSNQAEAEAKIPHLLQTKVAHYGVSLEPMLGPIDLSWWNILLNQVIVGGESGPGARPMHPDWVRAIRDQCRVASVPLFVKQLGSAWARERAAKNRSGVDPGEWPEDLRVRNFPPKGADYAVQRCGSRASSRS